MKKLILFAVLCLGVLVMGMGCSSFSPSTNAQFEAVLTQVMNQAIPQAQQLVDKQVASGKISKAQGETIMKLVAAMVAEKELKELKAKSSVVK